MAKKIIRIGVGTPDAPKSTIWSVTVSGSEVYFAQRSSFRAAKFSLHSSGKWRFAVSSEKWTKQNDRAVRKWDRPNPIFDTWILGPTIVFPPIILESPLSPLDQYNKEIVWLSAPINEQERLVRILFSKGQDDLTNFLETTKLSPDWWDSLSVEDNGRVNADKVWVVSCIQKLRDCTKNEMNDILNGMKIHYTEDSDSTGIFGVATPIYSPSEAEKARGLSPSVIEIILGEKNLEEDKV